MKTWSKKKKILIALLLLFIAAQAIRPAKNTGSSSGPQDVTTVVQVPDSMMALLKTSCYDCHSNHSDYPWYDQIAPVSWWVSNHINEGKRELNFTQFGSYTAKKKAHKMEEIAKTVEKDEMPISSYLWMHGNAQLTAEQKSAIISWAKAAQKTLQPQAP